MATVAENLQAAKEALAEKLVAACEAVGPSYSIDGQSVDRLKYIADLQAQIAALNETLVQEAPYELRSELL